MLIDWVALALCGRVCGANPWADRERFSLVCQEWFEPFSEDPNGVPSLDTFGRVFRCRHTADLQADQSNWAALRKSVSACIIFAIVGVWRTICTAEKFTSAEDLGRKPKETVAR